MYEIVSYYQSFNLNLFINGQREIAYSNFPYLIPQDRNQIVRALINSILYLKNKFSARRLKLDVGF